MTFALVNLETPHSELILGAMWQEKMAVYLISWQFTDGFHITKATIHPRYGNRILGYIKRLILLELSFCTEEISHFNVV